MREVRLGDEMVLQVYGSIKELPIRRSKSFNKYLMIDAGIGARMEDVDDHMGNLLHFLGNGKAQEAMDEAKNMRLNFYQMLMGLDSRCMSMLCLVHSVNGVPFTDDSEGGLIALKDRLSEYPVGALEDALEEVKKNLIPSARFIFQDSLATISSITSDGSNI